MSRCALSPWEGEGPQLRDLLVMKGGKKGIPGIQGWEGKGQGSAEAEMGSQKDDWWWS